MFLVLPRDKKKNKFFINKNTKPLKSILVKVEKIKAEDRVIKKFYHYDVFVEIDKRYAIEKDIKKVDVEISYKSLDEINNRESMLSGIDTKNTKQINLVAMNAQSIRMESVINNKRKLKIKKIGQISSDSVFNSKTASKIKSFNLPDNKIFTKKRKRYILRKQNKELIPENSQKNFLSRENTNFLKLHEKVGRKNRNSSGDVSLKFKKKFNKLILTGRDPLKQLNKTIKNNTRQSSFNFLKGRNQTIKKPSNYDSKNILNVGLTAGIKNNFNNVNQISESGYELIFETNSSRNAVLKQRIKISEKHFRLLKKANLKLIFIAKNKNNVSIDVTEGHINHYEEKKRLDFPSFDFEIEAVRSFRNDIRLQIKNNDNKQRTFNVYVKKSSGYVPYYLQNFKIAQRSVKIKAKQQKTLFRKPGGFSGNRSIFFRVNIVHDGIEYANSKFASIEIPAQVEKTCYLGIIAKCKDLDAIEIKVQNLPVNANRIKIVKRNLSKKEKKFKAIKTIKNGLLIPDNGKFLKDATYCLFYDNDVEINNVYEYKAHVYDENNNLKMSGDSFVEQYVKKSGMLEINSGLNIINEFQGMIQYKLEGSIKQKLNDADRVFKDMFGRFYDLFEDELKEIKDLNGLTYNLLIEVYQVDSTKTIMIDDVEVDKDGNFEKTIELDTGYDHVIKIIPRALPPSEMISKINNNIPLLAKKARFLPISAFNTAAIKRMTKNANRNVVSYTGLKYSSKANRLHGKILKRDTALKQNNFDLYFDGETGDNYYIDILAKNEHKKTYTKAAIEGFEGKIKLLTPISPATQNDSNFELKDEKYLASLTIGGINESVDFFKIFYLQKQIGLIIFLQYLMHMEKLFFLRSL